MEKLILTRKERSSTEEARCDLRFGWLRIALLFRVCVVV